MENQIDRRGFLGGSAMLGAVASAAGQSVSESRASNASQFWPNGARMVVSVSLQMEAGAQPASGAESPMPKIDSKYPDLPAGKWYDYGFKEGLPRRLHILDRRQVRVTSHMV